MTTRKSILSWRLLFTQSILAVYIYVFMEWLFFATKPSFMDALPLGKKLELFLLAGLVPAASMLPILIILRILGWIPGFLGRWQVFLYLGAVLPTLAAAALSLLLIDNFTYTMFRFGIVTSQGFVRAGYGMLAVVLAAVWYRQTILNIRLHGPTGPIGKVGLTTWQTFQCLLAVALLVISLSIGTIRVATASEILSGETALLERPPHIILVGGDGTVAANMSLYGYERDTTPLLRQLAEEGLLAENNFSNAAHSTGSVVSMLTGKYPSQTRVLYSPNILKGEDSIQHLPGILQRAGYTTVQIATPYYLDAYDVNMQEAFDTVNGRSIGQGEIFRLARQYHLEDAGYFLPRLWERIVDRILHISFVRTMPDPYREVTQAVDVDTGKRISDQERIRQVIRLLRWSDTPLFIHVHLMDTHGPRFYPQRQEFSTGQNQGDEWMQDFFDDAVMEYDSYVGRILNALNNNGLMDYTILIVYSDHASNWRTDDRVPLLLRFPHGEFAGRIHENTQNLDIAPTLLDYLGMEIPGWMPGQSLIGGELSATRPILSAGVVGVDCQPPDWLCEIDESRITPDFQQFGYIQLTVCQQMYTLTLETNTLATSRVREHTAPCPQADLPTPKEARRLIHDHLSQNGFDISMLE